MDQKQKILSFIKTQMLGVVSTVDRSNKPESAIVAVSETENLELIFGTSSESRKFANIAGNPSVSFVVGWGPITIQYEGTARLTEGKEALECQEMHLAKNPASKKFASDPKQ